MRVGGRMKDYEPLLFDAILCSPSCAIVSIYIYEENENYKLYNLNPLQLLYVMVVLRS